MMTYKEAVISKLLEEMLGLNSKNNSKLSSTDSPFKDEETRDNKRVVKKTKKRWTKWTSRKNT